VICDNTATFQDWADALGLLLRSPSERRSFRCPNCGVRALQIVYVGNPESRVGYCSLWCDNCRYGIQPSRVIIPDGVPGVIASAIPDFARSIPTWTSTTRTRKCRLDDSVRSFRF